MQVMFSLRPEDVKTLRRAAKGCGISLNQYVKEVAECKAAQLRNDVFSQEETADVSMHR